VAEAEVGQPRLIRIKSYFSRHTNFMMTRTEPISSFFSGGKETNGESIEVTAATEPSGKRNILG
jgi:hypothetical protein